MLQRPWFKWAGGFFAAGAVLIYTCFYIAEFNRRTTLPGGTAQAWGEGLGYSIPILLVSFLVGYFLAGLVAQVMPRKSSKK